MGQMAGVSSNTDLSWAADYDKWMEQDLFENIMAMQKITLDMIF